MSTHTLRRPRTRFTLGRLNLRPLSARRFAWSLLLIALLATGAQAEERYIALNGDLGVGGVNGIAHSTLQTGVDIRYQQFAAGLFGRIRFVLKDMPNEGVVRNRDFDEASDYVHILRYLSYRAKVDETTLRFDGGELLGATFGHGTLLRDYSNLGDPDHLHSGLRMTAEHPGFVATAMLDNILSPTVVGLHGEVRPLYAAPNLWRGLSFGASLVIDPQAPRTIISGSDGTRVADSAFNLQSNTEVLTMAGFSAALQFGEKQRHFTPYGDLNTSFYGVGFHLGAHGEHPLAEHVFFSAQLEYRLSTAGYAPDYIGTFYDVDRFQASLNRASPELADDTNPKLDVLRSGATAGHGFLAQLGVRWRRWVEVKVGTSRHPRPDKMPLWLRVSVEPFDGLNLGSMFLLRDVERPDGAAGVAMLSEGRFRFNDHLYVLGQYSRRWALDGTSYYFTPRNAFNIAFGATWSGS